MIDSDLTKLEQIEDQKGSSALRNALRRISRDEPIDDLVDGEAPSSPGPTA